ncbi:exocyst complex component (SEC6) [Vairimorpha necatrix]|uniref:Exocyst complex component (SEC6) n=1 Tax=Vairimorpha necatrix TaxID=6039 RepID=A0AAX4J8T2_9MICR
MEKRVFDELSDKIKYPGDLQSKIESISANVKDLFFYNQNLLSNKMLTSHTLLRDIEKEIENIEITYKEFLSNKDRKLKILNDFLVLIKDYKTVKMVCQAHSNLLKVKMFTEKMATIYESVFDENLEIYHSKIFDLEDFMYELEYFNKDLARDDYIEVVKAISHIKKEILDFNCKILELGEDFIENWEILPKVCEIIKKEEKRDEITNLVKEGEHSSDLIPREMYKSYKKFLKRTNKNLQERLKNSIKSSIRNKFNKLEEESQFVKKLYFVIEDLRNIQEKIDLHFFNFDEFLKEYHLNLKRLLDSRSNDLDAGEILAVIEFVTDYYENVESTFKKIADSLGDKLLENEDELLERYSKTAEQKLKEWISNITKLEINKFYLRNEEISRDEEDKLISPGFVSLLQIINMQLEPISFNKRIFARITKTIIKNCNIFKDELINAMEKDFRPSVELKSKAGYKDFCIMFGNSGLKLTQYITTLPQCQSPEIRELGNTFMNILKASNLYLSRFILETCQPVTKDIFLTKWYEEEIVKILILTIKDFLKDYELTMSEYSFMTFIHELTNSISLIYMKQLGNKKAKIYDQCSSRLKSDYIKIKRTLDEFGEKDDVMSGLSPLLKIIPLIDCKSVELFVEEVKSLQFVFPDINRKFIKTIITKRRDLTEEEKKIFVNHLKECFGEILPTEKTIFSKMFGI